MVADFHYPVKILKCIERWTSRKIYMNFPVGDILQDLEKTLKVPELGLVLL